LFKAVLIKYEANSINKHVNHFELRANRNKMLNYGLVVLMCHGVNPDIRPAAVIYPQMKAPDFSRQFSSRTLPHWLRKLMAMSRFNLNV
jgi:hypothetical protein